MRARTFRRGFSLVELFIVLAIVGVLGTLIVTSLGGGCIGRVGPDKAVQVAKTNGFTDVRVTDTDRIGVSWSGCGSDDSVAFAVSAKNSLEQPVDFTVCCGEGFNAKGCTIRY